MRTQWLALRIAAAAGVVAVIGMGAPAVADPTPTPSRTPTPTPTRGPCDPPPVSGSVIGQTATSLTFALILPAPVFCDPPFQPAQVRVYTSFDDAQMFRNPRGSAVANTPAEAAALTVTQLAPDTAYWYNFSGGGSPFTSSPMGPTYTLPDTGCTATYQLDRFWNGGFIARVIVQNTSGNPTTGWQVAWTWPNGQALTATWRATATSTGGRVSAANTHYNGNLAAGASTTFGFLGTGAAPTDLALTCSPTTG